MLAQAAVSSPSAVHMLHMLHSVISLQGDLITIVSGAQQK